MGEGDGSTPTSYIVIFKEETTGDQGTPSLIKHKVNILPPM